MKEKILKAKELSKVGYIPTPKISIAIEAAVNSNIPIIIEGAPGTGKTELAKAVAELMGYKFKRVTFYEGITADKILYDYDYAKQLLSLDLLKPNLEKKLKGKEKLVDGLSILKEIDFYSEDFLLNRPVLDSIVSEEKTVLLLDEVDKASEEVEYALLEFLEDYSLSIPQLGTLKAKHKPIVILTSNNYRDLSDALKRRCLYLYIPAKTEKEIQDILMHKAEVNKELAVSLAQTIVKINKLHLKQAVSISEAIEWAKYVKKHDVNIANKDEFNKTLFLLSKNEADQKVIAHAKNLNK